MKAAFICGLQLYGATFMARLGAAIIFASLEFVVLY
jgi:hypothetical protein